MSAARTRLVVVMTHPVQYLSPWFRYIHAHDSSLDLTVVYATEPTPAQQGVGFECGFEWDIPLREGYRSIVVRPAQDDVSLDSSHFFGIDVPEVAEAVRELEPDAVLVPGWHSVTEVRTIVALRRAGIPLLYRGDSHLHSGSTRWRALSRARARLMLRQFTGFLAVGTRSREYLRAMGVAEPAIVSSPHAVDNEGFRARAEEARARRVELRTAFGFAGADRVVLYAGKLTGIKRPADVIDAVAVMRDAAALIVGDGPEREELRQRARERGVHAVFTGFLNQDRIVDAYVAADALMLPGRETWGLVANEALACGLPVVMSDQVGSSPDLASPDVCAVVPHADIHAFAHSVSSIIDRRLRRKSGVAACEAVADRFSYEAATRGLAVAATFAARNRRPAGHAPARVIALCGNLVFAGGMERITFEALGALTRGGADVQALVNSWSSRPIAELAERAGASWRVGRYNARLDGVFRHPLRLARALGDVALASGQLTRLLVSRRATHVIAADFRAVLLHAPALVICRLLGVPVVLRSGVAPTRSPLHDRLWRWLIGPLVTRHVANSAFTAAELQAVGVDPQRIITIHNVAPSRTATGDAPGFPHEGRVAYVGQVIPHKGVLPLLEAVALLVQRGYDVSLDIAGQMEGWATADVHDYRAKVQERATRSDVRGRVRFLGWCENVDEVLKDATLHCCPSQPGQREGFGITVVEAKRAGLPSVVCPSGALPELIEHQRDGWITRGFDAAAIAEGLEWFLADDARLAVAQQAAFASAQRFDPAVFDRRWQEEFGLQSVRRTDANRDCALADAQGT